MHKGLWEGRTQGRELASLRLTNNPLRSPKSDWVRVCNQRGSHSLTSGKRKGDPPVCTTIQVFQF